MLVAYYRNGHATNSSSSHSVVRRSAPVRQETVGNEFGWENFTLTSRYQKSLYFAMQAMYNYMEMGMSEPDAIAAAAPYFPLIDPSEMVDGYIDHESELSFGTPRLRDGSMAEVWAWINKHIIEDDEVVVLGGNDNSDGHPLLKDNDTHDFVPWVGGYRSTAHTSFIRDEFDGHLTFYNAENGHKVRLVGDNGVPAYSSVPELIDVSITDQCFSRCEYCYRNCDSKGSHADVQEMYSLAYRLGESGVFEVAIGGGEPTLHPNFAEILSAFNHNGVTPNLSTKEPFFNDDVVAAMKENCGSVAYSTQDHHEAVRWLSMADTLGLPSPAIHYIVGLNSIEELGQMIDAVQGFYDHRLVLLKFKPIGRGENIAPHNSDGWADIVDGSRMYSWGNIALDSALAKDAEIELPSADARTLGSEDGRFSMYYDAVNHKAAAHSFLPMDDMDDCEPWKVIDWWKEHIKTI